MLTPFRLTREQARSFYNRFGRKQDWQRLYEGPAIRDLLAHGAFENARIRLWHLTFPLTWLWLPSHPCSRSKNRVIHWALNERPSFSKAETGGEK
jgi:hypothetical protein